MGKTPDLGQQAEALRELVREANGTIKDLRAATKEAREAGLAAVKDYLDAAVAEGLRDYNGTIKVAMGDAVAKVTAEFDALSNLLMGRTAEDKQEGKASIPELVHELTREPETIEDPRRLGGNLTGTGGPHDKGGTTIDTRDAVLLDYAEVATGEDASDGTGDAIALLLGGRVNGSKDTARIVYLMDVDGAAAIVTELEALVRRGARDGWADRYANAKAWREARLKAAGTWQ